MKTGIIGLPQVGKTSLFKILTRADISNRSSNPREAHIGIATVPDDRLDRLAAQCNPRKLVHAQVEYADVGAIGQEALKETAYLANLRGVDALVHVLRVFEDDSIPHVGGTLDAIRDISNVEFDLMVSDLGQVEARLERMKKDLLKKKTPELEKENELLQRTKVFLESERPLREMEMTKEEKKVIRGFMFLSEKPILYVLNISESTTLGVDLDAAVEKYGLTAYASQAEHGRQRDLRQGGSGAGGHERRRSRRIFRQLRTDRERPHAAHPQELRTARTDLVFHRRAKTSAAPGPLRRTPGRRTLPERFTRICRSTSSAPRRFAGMRCSNSGSEAAARAAGKLRLEGKEYIVQDGDILHIRHSG